MDKQQIILDSEEVVFHIAKMFYVNAFSVGIEYDDLVQVGYVAVLEAIDSYDCDKKAALSTHIFNMITYKIKNYINENSYITHVPMDYILLINRVISIYITSYNETGNFLSEKEILNKLGQDKIKTSRLIDENSIRLMLDTYYQQHRSSVLLSIIDESLKDPNFENRGVISVTFDDINESKKANVDVEEEGIKRYFLSEINTIINGSEKNDYTILREKFGLDGDEPCTNLDLARKYGKTSETQRNRCIRATKKLRKQLKI